MSEKTLKQRVRKKMHPATSELLRVAYAKVANAVHDYHPSSLVLGFIVGLSFFALGAFNPVLAQDKPFQSQGGKQEEQESGTGLPPRNHQSDFRQTQNVSKESMRRQRRQDANLTRRFVAQLGNPQDLSDGSKPRLNISAGDLQPALLALSEQAGLQLLYPSELIAGLQTQGVQGSYTPEDALKELLNGTGLDYRFSDSSTATLQRTASAQVVGNAQSDNTIIQADPIVIEETVRRSKVFLPPVDGYKAEQATTSTRSALSIDETPASIGVVTRDLIKDTFSRTQSDAFEHVSGVGRSNSISLGRVEAFNIRGFSTSTRLGTSGSLRSNGLPVGHAFTPDPALIERYEIVKGPAAIVSGTAPPGGVVNRIMKSPQETNFATSEFTAGSFDLYRGVLDANGVLPSHQNVRGRMIFAVEEGGSFVDDTPIRQYTVAPSLEIELFGGAGTLLLTGLYQKFDGVNDSGLPLIDAGDNVPDIPRTRNVGGGAKNGAKSDFEVEDYELHYKHQFHNDLNLSFKGKYEDSELEQTTLIPSGSTFFTVPGLGQIPGGSSLAQPNGDVAIFANDERVDWETFAGEIFVSKEFEWFSQRHEVLLGVDHRDQQFDLRRNNSRAAFGLMGAGIDNLFSPTNAFQAPSGLAFEDGARIRRIELAQTAVFGQVVARPTSKLILVGAFRHDWVDIDNRDIQEDNNLAPPFNNTPHDIHTQGKDAEWSGRVGATYEVVPNLRMYAGFARSFESNAFSVSSDGSLLPPQTGEIYEVGAKWGLLDGRIRLTTALFHIDRENVPIPDPTTFPQFLASNPTSQRSRGAELDIVGEPWAGLNLNGNFSFINTEIRDSQTQSGQTPPGVPTSYVGKVFATYTVQTGPLQGLGFGGGVYFQSGYDIFNGSTLVAKLENYERVDAVVFYRPKKKVYDLTINVRNLLDERYIESAGFRQRGNGFGAPVSVFGTLRIKFASDLEWSLW